MPIVIVFFLPVLIPVFVGYGLYVAAIELLGLFVGLVCELAEIIYESGTTWTLIGALTSLGFAYFSSQPQQYAGMLIAFIFIACVQLIRYGVRR